MSHELLGYLTMYPRSGPHSEYSWGIMVKPHMLCASSLKRIRFEILGGSFLRYVVFT